MVSRFRRRSVLLFLLAHAAVLIPEIAAAQGIVQLFRRSFLPALVDLPPGGGTVTWQWVQGEHRITSGTPEEPTELFEAEINESNPEFTFTFTEAGSYAFFDAVHPETAGVGTVTVPPDDIEHLVVVVDNAYIPENLFIFAGDRVWWRHDVDEAFHTVTSGKSSNPEDNPGERFDAESSNDKPNFRWTFEEPELFHYFCIPHEAMGMVGTVLIQRKFLRGDYNMDGAREISDAVAILFALFLGGQASTCDDAADVDDNEFVELTDAVNLLAHLFLGTFSMPRPDVAAGPDRTGEDGLLCNP